MLWKKKQKHIEWTQYEIESKVEYASKLLLESHMNIIAFKAQSRCIAFSSTKTCRTISFFRSFFLQKHRYVKFRHPGLTSLFTCFKQISLMRSLSFGRIHMLVRIIKLPFSHTAALFQVIAYLTHQFKFFFFCIPRRISTVLQYV